MQWGWPQQKDFLGRQMTAAADKKSTTSPSLFMETCGLEVEEELSALATRYWAEGGVEWKMAPCTKRSVDEASTLSAIMEADKRTCRSSDV